MATLSLGDVGQVEVLKGPFSAMYGSDAMGGVVNVVTKRNKDKLTGDPWTLAAFKSGGENNIMNIVLKKLNKDLHFFPTKTNHPVPLPYIS